ncbi:adaptin N terminal region-domain-containing protein [Blastocladiella britannica]|nr:adaptin N terminal region-domain-containing protein [Blastocladiella britannica]
MVLRLKDFIKQIRACKTAADERAVVARESAVIRTSFKEDAAGDRHANVAKLLYIHMLGYPAHFGQMECVKLVASPRFADKRLGYLGIMLLLDENQETLTLVTNSLKNDLNHPNMYVVGLALCTMGNIGSVEMARDLYPEIEKLLGSSNSYVRKKASLTAVRVIRKVPDLLDAFAARSRAMLGERNHGALLTGLTLIHAMCVVSPAALAEFRTTVPGLVKVLKNLVTTGYSPEHDVAGITDPFLQVKILRLLRLLGTGDKAAAEHMNDVLAQVATTTDGAKNVGNAILYETVVTVLAIDAADAALRVLAINILGKFLGNKDNNIRYVALQTLLKTIAVDAAAVQRHRATVLECLHDADASIRKRALELAFALVTPANVRSLTRDLLAFLEVADAEFRPGMVADLARTADKYAPNVRWHFDTLVRVMKLGGAHVGDEIVAQAVRLVATAPADLQAYAVRKLYDHVVEDKGAQAAAALAAVWCIGEYGDLLVRGPTTAGGGTGSLLDPEDDTPDLQPVGVPVTPAPTEAAVVATLETVVDGTYVTPTLKQYTVSALMKLSVRFSDPAATAAIQRRIGRYSTAMPMEVQQRAVEGAHMFAQLDAAGRVGLWERMAVPEPKEGAEGKYARNAAAAAAEASGSLRTTAPTAAATPAPSDAMSALLDLEGLSLGGPSDYGGAANKAAPSSNPLDLMADIFSTPATQAASPKATAAQDPLSMLMGLGTTSQAAAPGITSPAAHANPLADLLGSTAAAPPAADVWNREYACHRTADVSVTLAPVQVSDPSAGALVQVNATVTNVSGTAIEGLQLMVAVPKSHKIAMAPLSTTSLPTAGSVAMQAFRVLNPERKPIKLKVKIVYSTGAGAGTVDEVANFAFPESVL